MNNPYKIGDKVQFRNTGSNQYFIAEYEFSFDTIYIITGIKDGIVMLEGTNYIVNYKRLQLINR